MRILTLLAVLALVGCTQGQTENKQASASNETAAGDYMSADLRSRVESLKQQVQNEPEVESIAALNDRAQLLYAWANAMALKGDDIPWSLPQSVASIARFNNLPRGESLPPAQLRRGTEQINDYVEQLRLRDENPAALGVATLRNPGPHPVRSYQTIEVGYEVGSEGLAEGGSIYLGVHNRAGISLQADDPGGEDFVTAASSREGVTLVVDEAVGSGRRQALKFDVVGGNLAPGDTVIFRYGDTSGGGPGSRMQTPSNDFIPMEVHVAFVPGGTRYTLPRMGLKTEGGEIAGVRGFAPSIVAAGESFSMSVRSEDLYTNRATGTIPAFELLLDGKPYRTLAAGNALTEVRDIAFDEPGVYRFSIRSTDGNIVGEVNPVLVESSPVTRIYWGETHGHSGMAEGQGTSDAFFAFGRDDARLDFLVHSEHDIWMDDAEWRELAANTREFLKEGEFIPFLGYEWTVEQAYGGHHNVVFRTPDDRIRIPQQTHPALSQLYAGLRQHHDPEDVLIIPHAHQAGDWRNSDPTMETLVEIQSNHGVFEWFGHMYLRNGHHVGFVSASDDHTSHPGYGVSRGRRSGLGAVMAPTKTSEAIFDSMKNLATYASTGDRPIVRFAVNGAPMGQRAAFAENRTLSGEIYGTAPIDELVVLRNSEEIWREDLRTLKKADSANQAIEVNMLSGSQPLLDQRDNPRGGRPWAGTIEVTGARLQAVRAPGFIDVTSQGFEIDADNPNLVRFRTWTRGNHSSLILELAGVTAATKINVDIAPARESATNNYTRYRDSARIPRWRASFPLAQLKEGQLHEVQDVEGHIDQLWVRRVVPAGALDHKFEFVDKSARQGDYYTLRLVQENDQMAWSSPVWVGGYSPR
ncbi:MAG: DUF3604 domain-containing protein [Pseudomonadota bacterium]